MSHYGSGAILLAAAGLLAAGLVGGCFSANVDSSGWQSVAREYKDAYAPSSPQRDRAVQSAREKAIEEGLTSKELADYDIRTAYQEPFWWVDFRREDRKGKSWPDRFVIRVDEKGRTLLYKDPAKAPEH
jgi:hypothetical protein